VLGDGECAAWRAATNPKSLIVDFTTLSLQSPCQMAAHRMGVAPAGALLEKKYTQYE
jgi:hypothetical protein